MKDKIFVSFSGGKTSAYMCQWILMFHGDKEIIFVFANTGQEHPKTYEFIENVTKHHRIDVIWVEAVIPESREEMTSYRIVTPETACKDGSIFEDAVKRYGVFNQGFPACTRELKIKPMEKFVKEKWGVGKFCTAIGIRADEIDRVNDKYEKLNYWYPLAFNGVTKEEVNAYWETMPFNLEIPEHLGNCTWCWKKTYSKHMKIIAEMPEAYDVPKYLEEKYRINNIPTQKMRFGEEQSFFRKHKRAVDLFDEKRIADLAEDDREEGYENSCAESCDIYEDIDWDKINI